MLGPSACRAPLPDSCDRDPDPGLGGHPAPPGRHALQGADTEPAQVRLPHQPPLRPQRRVSPCPGGPCSAPQFRSSTRACEPPNHWLSFQYHTSFLPFPREKALRGSCICHGVAMSRSWLCARCPNTSRVPCAHSSANRAARKGGCDFGKHT